MEFADDVARALSHALKAPKPPLFMLGEILVEE
jgi:hypothetical protein